MVFQNSKLQLQHRRLPLAVKQFLANESSGGIQVGGLMNAEKAVFQLRRYRIHMGSPGKR